MSPPTERIRSDDAKRSLRHRVGGVGHRLQCERGEGENEPALNRHHHGEQHGQHLVDAPHPPPQKDRDEEQSQRQPPHMEPGKIADPYPPKIRAEKRQRRDHHKNDGNKAQKEANE